MVLRRVIQRRIVQSLVARAKPRFTKYITSQYGEVAGFAAGVAISVGAGDYYGAFTGAADYLGGKPPGGRNPPFGYFPGAGLNGPTNGSFNQALRPVQYRYRNRRNSKYTRGCACCCKRRKQHSFRRRRR